MIHVLGLAISFLGFFGLLCCGLDLIWVFSLRFGCAVDWWLRLAEAGGWVLLRKGVSAREV